MSGHASGPPPPEVFLIPALFPVLWVTVTAVISAVGGWGALGKEYRADGPAPTGTRSFQSGSFGITRYNGCLRIGHSEAGLFLAIFPLFRPFHPPLLIPWGAITRRTGEKHWGISYNVLEVGGSRPVRLTFRAGTTAPFERRLQAIDARDKGQLEGMKPGAITPS
jgi:hypothetical protein